jgi:hypothetical protein
MKATRLQPLMLLSLQLVLLNVGSSHVPHTPDKGALHVQTRSQDHKQG